ncbi:hypothetical protein AB1Y20_009153 [Prymnesium parvum]|uniref:non-specific serine/threonine protein kinase n=1 Tax=Prymnesium parvum TaxID=97485 RepID=A0AB34K3I9_PRYPA
MTANSSEHADDDSSFARLFREIREVGRGAHGRVLLVEHVSSGDRYVLKQIPLSQLPSGVLTALPEVEVLCRLAHTNVTRLYGAWRLHDHLNILMEYADGGTLADAIKARSSLTKLFDEDTVLDWFVQIASALAHMHANSIIHRDLKAHNIFLTSRNIVKVGDFGISKVLDGTSVLAKTAVGTPYYLAPEVINGEPYGCKADVWALGVLLYELTTLRKPFDADSLPALAMRIMRASYPPPPSSFSSELCGLIASMLQRDPAKRPTLAEVVVHPLVWKQNERLQAQLRSLALTAFPLPIRQPLGSNPSGTRPSTAGALDSVHSVSNNCTPPSNSPSAPQSSGGRTPLSESAQQERATACALRMRMLAEGAVASRSTSDAASGHELEDNLRFSHNLQALEFNLMAVESGEILPDFKRVKSPMMTPSPTNTPTGVSTRRKKQSFTPHSDENATVQPS